MPIQFKRGGTFLLQQITFYKNKTTKEPQPLNGITITAHIRKGSALVAELKATILDEAQGKFSLECEGSTENWPADTLVACDIRLVLNSGFILLSKTFEIFIEKNITKAPTTP